MVLQAVSLSLTGGRWRCEAEIVSIRLMSIMGWG